MMYALKFIQLPPYMFLKADSQNNVTHHFGIVVEMLNWLAAYTRTRLLNTQKTTIPYREKFYRILIFSQLEILV